MSIFFAADEAGFDWSIVMLIGVLVLFVVFMFVMPLITKRRQGSVPELYANLSVGDKVMTIGGIIGTIAEIKEKSPTEKEILIETGAEGSKTTIWLDIKGIYQNLTKPPVPVNFFGKPKTPAAAAPAPVSETSAQESPVFDEPAAVAEEPAVSVDPFEEQAPAADAAARPEIAPESVEPASGLTAPAAKTGSAAKTTKSTKK